MTGQQLRKLKIQVFSNGHFQPVKDTPWAGVQHTPAFKQVLPRAIKGEVVKVKDRQFRVVGL